MCEYLFVGGPHHMRRIDINDPSNFSLFERPNAVELVSTAEGEEAVYERADHIDLNDNHFNVAVMRGCMEMVPEAIVVSGLEPTIRGNRGR